MIRPDGVPGVAFGTALDGDPRLDDAIRLELSGLLEIPSSWAWVRQMHGVTVVEPDRPGLGAEADALITTDPALPIAISVADCLPVALVADGAVGLVHAGWRGAAAGVVAAAASALAARGHPPRAAVIGPGIGSCCFEVGEDVAKQFPENRAHTSWGAVSVDLQGVVAADLDEIDVHVVSGCTHHEDRFHSYRRDGSSLRQFGVAWVPSA